MAEGDTVHRTARALDAALRAKPIVEVEVPSARSPLRLQPDRVARLRGAALSRAEARGKHLLLQFEGGLVLHSHLGMRGSWHIATAGKGRRDARAWVVLSTREVDAVEVGGSRLEVRTEREVRADARLRALGPDLLDPGFDASAGVAALRRTAQSREVGEALIDQRVVAGAGNIYKSEGCWSARIDPWRRLGELSDDELRRLVVETAALMRYGLETGRMPHAVYRRAGRPCPRCGERIRSRGQGDANRTTYWCRSCQRTGDNSGVEEEE